MSESSVIERPAPRSANFKILMALARYYLALRLSAAMLVPLPARAEWFAPPAPIVRRYESQRRDPFDERELLHVGEQSLVLIRPLISDNEDRISLN